VSPVAPDAPLMAPERRQRRRGVTVVAEFVTDDWALAGAGSRPSTAVGVTWPSESRRRRSSAYGDGPARSTPPRPGGDGADATTPLAAAPPDPAADGSERSARAAGAAGRADLGVVWGVAGVPRRHGSGTRTRVGRRIRAGRGRRVPVCPIAGLPGGGRAATRHRVPRIASIRSESSDEAVPVAPVVPDLPDTAQEPSRGRIRRSGVAHCWLALDCALAGLIRP